MTAVFKLTAPLLFGLWAACAGDSGGERGQVGTGERPAALPEASSAARPQAEPAEPSSHGPGEAAGRYIAVIAPAEAIDISSQASGELASVLVRPGDAVSPGQRIASISPRQLREEVLVAEAALASARAALLQADIDIADAERALAMEERAVAAGTSPRSQLEAAEFAVRRARAVKERAQAALAEERVRLGKAQNRLADADIKAPFAGKVAVRYRDPGAMVGPDTPIVRLIAAGGVRVMVAVPPGELAAFRVGSRIAVEIDTVPEPKPAVIRQIAPELDPASKHFFVEAELELGGGDTTEVRPGLAAWARPAP